MRKAILYIFALAISAICACEKLETYPDIPQVEFVQVYLADTIDKLENQMKFQKITIKVTDGDGNLGYRRTDVEGVYGPESEFYNNLKIGISVKKGGEYQRLEALSKNLGYRLPYHEPMGQNKFLRADVEIKVEIPLPNMDFDTIRYDFQVWDRDLNPSEIAYSCDIPIREHGTVWASGKYSFFPPKEETDEDTEQQNNK